MKKHTTSTAIPTYALKAEALASMSASFERFCLAAGLETLSGRCHVVGGLVAKEHDENQLLRISVPSGDHSPGDLALSPVHAQLS